MGLIIGIVVLGVAMAVIVAVGAGVAALLTSAKSKTGAVSRKGEEALPYAAKRYVFSRAERAFYDALKKVIPSSHTIFAKVRVADLLFVRKGSASWQSHFNKISCKHADFVICDASIRPVVVIELDDSSHDADDRKERDAFVDRAFSAAEMPLVHVRAQASYRPEDLQRLLMHHVPTCGGGSVGESASRIEAHPDAKYMPR